MKSALVYELHYKRILEEARQLSPGFTDPFALVVFMEVKAAVVSSAIMQAENDRAVKAFTDKAWAGELYQVVEGRKN